MNETPRTLSYEQQARDMLERMGVEDAQAWSSGEVIELANLLADRDRLRKVSAPDAPQEKLDADDWDIIEDGLRGLISESEANAENWRGRSREGRYRAEAERESATLAKVERIRAAKYVSPDAARETPQPLDSWHRAEIYPQSPAPEIAHLRHAMQADEARVRRAAERVGVLYVGCDTADALADEIERLRLAPPAQGTATLRRCTCVGHCRGRDGLSSNWLCEQEGKAGKIPPPPKRRRII